MSCPNCICPNCRRDGVAVLVHAVGQVNAAKLLGVSQSTISRHMNREVTLPGEFAELADFIRPLLFPCPA